jgi:glutamine amidotransferase
VILIVDYGMGNLRSVQKAFERIGCAAEVSDDPQRVAAAERLVVPGVGAFGDAMAALRQRRLVEPICDFCAGGRPLLGICLGLQVLFDESEEVAGGAAACAPEAAGTARGRQGGRLNGSGPGGAGAAGQALEKGLGRVPGRVVRFGPHVTRAGLKVPHMGWNRVVPAKASPLWAGMPEEGVYFYFAHSYYACPADEGVVAGRTDYGGPFASAIACGNLYATQFHPEKSQAMGLRLLENFVTRT